MQTSRRVIGAFMSCCGVNAASAASTMRTRLIEGGSDLAQDARFSFRAGVRVGDIVVEGADIYGDGVNIAAKLEAAALPRRALIYGRANGDGVDKLVIDFEDFEQPDIGGVARPQETFAIVGDAATPLPQNPEKLLKPSVADKPFTNMSPDPKQAYFADGLTKAP